MITTPTPSPSMLEEIIAFHVTSSVVFNQLNEHLIVFEEVYFGSTLSSVIPLNGTIMVVNDTCLPFEIPSNISKSLILTNV